MKKKITFSLLLFYPGLCTTFSFAQIRYIDPVFASIDTINNVTYGVNFSVMINDTLPIPTGMTIPVGVDSATGTLFTLQCPFEFDVFEPSGDTVAERPLIIYLHTGTFAPIIRNGNPTGSRTYDYATSSILCSICAQRLCRS